MLFENSPKLAAIISAGKIARLDYGGIDLYLLIEWTKVTIESDEFVAGHSHIGTE